MPSARASWQGIVVARTMRRVAPSWPSMPSSLEVQSRSCCWFGWWVSESDCARLNQKAIDPGVAVGDNSVASDCAGEARDSEKQTGSGSLR